MALTSKQKIIAGAVAVVVAAGGAFALTGGTREPTFEERRAAAVKQLVADRAAKEEAGKAGLKYGPVFDEATLRTFTVSNVGIGMTAEEAQGILNGAGFEGELRLSNAQGHDGKFPLNSGTSQFGGLDGFVLFNTVRDVSGVHRVWAVQYQERFGAPQDHGVWLERVLQRYGSAPSRVGKFGPYDTERWTQVIYTSKPLPPNDIKRSVCGDGVSHISLNPYDKDASCHNLRGFDNFSLDYTTSLQGLMAVIQDSEIYITLADRAFAERVNNASNEQAASAKQQQLQQNSSETQVNF